MQGQKDAQECEARVTKSPASKVNKKTKTVSQQELGDQGVARLGSVLNAGLVPGEKEGEPLSGPLPLSYFSTKSCSAFQRASRHLKGREERCSLLRAL